MTVARTPSQRGRANRNKGHQAERDLCRWLRVNGFPGAERAVRTGFRVGDRVSADPGDVTGTPGIVCSVKDCAVEQRSVWMAELAAMVAGDAPGAVGLLVHKRRGHADPGRWWCWLVLGDLADLMTNGTWALPSDEHELPVRMELGHVVPLLRGAGYGTSIEESA